MAGSIAPTFRPDIEGLRGIAVLLVVLFHVKVPGFSGGFVGVDVFFVLSGYLITSLLVAEIEQTGRVSLFAFYARRARRLLPAAAVVLAVVLAASWVLLSPMHTTLAARAGRAMAMYMSNLWFLRETSDYFAASTETNPLLHAWSLAVEEQFYVVWPVLVLFGRHAAPSRGRLLWLMSAIALASFAASAWLTRTEQVVAFYGPHARAWEFAFGAIAGVAPAALLRRSTEMTWRVLGWLGLAAVLASAVLYSPTTAFPGVAALPPVLGTALVLAAWTGGRGRLARLLGIGALQQLGRLSYSWYLWHWPALVFGAALVPHIGLVGRLLCALAALGVAAAMYHLVENPIRFHRGLARRPVYGLALGLGLTVLCAAGATVVRGRAIAASQSPEQRAFVAAIDDYPPLVQQGCLQRWLEPGMKTCVAGDTASETVIVLFGDSHAAQWASAVDQAAQAHGWRLVTYLRSSCPTADVPIYLRQLRRMYTECETWRAAALEEIARLRPAVVLLSSALGYVGDAGLAGVSGGVSTTAWGEGQRRTLQRLAGTGSATVLLRDPPYQETNLPQCVSQAVWRGADPVQRCAFPRETSLPETIAASEREAVHGVPGARYLDLSDAFCTRTTCAAMWDGRLLYRDSNHLTDHSALALSDRIGAELAEAMQDQSQDEP